MLASDADAVVSILLADDFAADSPSRRLTRAEAARVRSLIIADGYTRAEALTHVRDFGAGEWFPAAQAES